MGHSPNQFIISLVSQSVSQTPLTQVSQSKWHMHSNEYLKIFLKVNAKISLEISLKLHYNFANSNCGILVESLVRKLQFVPISK
jgi:hypothetical protein